MRPILEITPSDINHNQFSISIGHGSLQDKHNNNISSSKKSLNRPHPPPKPPTNIQQAKHHYEQVQVQTVGASQAHYYSPLDQPAGHGYENRADMYHTLSPPTSRSALSIPVHAAANTGVYNQLHEAMSGRTLENTRGKPKVIFVQKLYHTKHHAWGIEPPKMETEY